MRDEIILELTGLDAVQRIALRLNLKIAVAFLFTILFIILLVCILSQEFGSCMHDFAVCLRVLAHMLSLVIVVQ